MDKFYSDFVRQYEVIYFETGTNEKNIHRSERIR